MAFLSKMIYSTSDYNESKENKNSMYNNIHINDFAIYLSEAIEKARKEVQYLEHTDKDPTKLTISKINLEQLIDLEKKLKRQGGRYKTKKSRKPKRNKKVRKSKKSRKMHKGRIFYKKSKRKGR